MFILNEQCRFQLLCFVFHSQQHFSVTSQFYTYATRRNGIGKRRKKAGRTGQGLDGSFSTNTWHLQSSVLKSLSSHCSSRNCPPIPWQLVTLQVLHPFTTNSIISSIQYYTLDWYLLVYSFPGQLMLMFEWTIVHLQETLCRHQFTWVEEASWVCPALQYFSTQYTKI